MLITNTAAPNTFRKLEAAGALQRALLLGAAAAAAAAPSDGGAAGLPALVRSHYVRALLDWAATSVAKKDPREQQAAGVPKLEPGCWATLRLALSDPALPGSLPLPPALFPAVVATVQLLLRQPQQAERLASELTELLALLRVKFLASFRPGLEHCAALAEAALQGWEENAALPQQSAWRGLAANAVLLLLVRLCPGSQDAEMLLVGVPEDMVPCPMQDACTDHPNQRKPFDAVVPRLLLPLARGAWPGGGAAAEGDACSAACLCVLDVALFSQAHIPGEGREGCVPATIDEEASCTRKLDPLFLSPCPQLWPRPPQLD